MNLTACLRRSPLAAAVLSSALLSSCFTPPPPPGYRPYSPYGPPPHLDYRPETYEPEFVGPPEPQVRQPQAPEPDYPTATRTNNPNQVISPFKPYNVIDVAGFNSGQLAKDPSNNRIFRVP